VKLYDGSGENSGFMKEQYGGPLVVATELFSNLYPLDSPEKNEIAIIDREGNLQNPPFCPALKVIKTARVGLMPKLTDRGDFYKNLPLRYITVLPRFPGFKQAIRGIEGLVGEKVLSGDYSTDVARDILGYNRKLRSKA
jgi:hypothetical protein